MSSARFPTGDNRVSVTFADEGDAQRAAADLQQLGINAERIRLHHGAGDQDVGAGRTGAEDELIAERMEGSFLGGALTGTLVGLVIGAIAGGIGFGWFNAAWFGTTIAAGVAGGGVGALWGFFSGFSHRREQTGRFDQRHPPRMLDQVTLTVDVPEPDQVEAVEKTLRAHGGR